MTTQACSPTLSLPLYSSRLYKRLLLAAHLLAALALLWTQIRWPWQLFVLALIAGHWFYLQHLTSWFQYLERLDYYGGQYRLHFTDGTARDVAVSAEMVTPWLTVLRIGLAGHQRALPLFRDSTDADQLRRLRVLLRCRSARATDG